MRQMLPRFHKGGGKRPWPTIIIGEHVSSFHRKSYTGRTEVIFKQVISKSQKPCPHGLPNSYNYCTPSFVNHSKNQDPSNFTTLIRDSLTLKTTKMNTCKYSRIVKSKNLNDFLNFTQTISFSICLKLMKVLFFFLIFSNFSLLEPQLTNISNPTLPIALISPTFSAAKPS